MSWKSGLDNPVYVSDTATKACPDDVETLASLMVEDLANYANRIIQRNRRLDEAADNSRYIILAGNPEFEPLSLGPGQYNPKVTLTEEEQPKQVFLTTLERQYIGVKALDAQSFHWLFLSQTTDGWRLAMMFTQIGSSSRESSPMPPQESSNWIIGQAVKLWLRDCRARAVRAS
ncbi:MAG: hypothetical protein F6K41_24530 [Symploca sp. SIO3E6]|nr:hypothetical protein [Caldora sp. SIO3E6]